MTNTTPFGDGADVELGAALRAHLDAPDPAGFAARVRAALPARSPSSGWEVLARWTTPRLAAAAILLAALGAWLAIPRTGAAASEPLLEPSRPVDQELVMTAMLREP
jgi:hypothetical protein